MRRAAAVLWRIVGVLLILLGLPLVASQITYTNRRTISLTPLAEVTMKGPRTIVIPRPVAVLVIVAGVAALILARSSPAKS